MLLEVAHHQLPPALDIVQVGHGGSMSPSPCPNTLGSHGWAALSPAPGARAQKVVSTSSVMPSSVSWSSKRPSGSSSSSSRQRRHEVRRRRYHAGAPSAPKAALSFFCLPRGDHKLVMPFLNGQKGRCQRGSVGLKLRLPDAGCAQLIHDLQNPEAARAAVNLDLQCVAVGAVGLRQR